MDDWQKSGSRVWSKICYKDLAKNRTHSLHNAILVCVKVSCRYEYLWVLCKKYQRFKIFVEEYIMCEWVHFSWCMSVNNLQYWSRRTIWAIIHVNQNSGFRVMDDWRKSGSRVWSEICYVDLAINVTHSPLNANLVCVKDNFSVCKIKLQLL